MKHPVTIALCGKGGVGKTTAAALMIKALVEKTDKKVLAIDADPAIGLSYALGLTVSKTVDDIRSDLIGRIQNDESDDKSGILRELDYDLFNALVEHKNIALLAIGRPEGEGCYCEVNNLLKEIIGSLSGSFDVIVIDGEAGIEQINRRVMKTVDHLILVSDTSAKGLNVADTIQKIARKTDAVEYREVGLLLNRIKTQKEIDEIMSRLGLTLMGWLPEDPTVYEFDYKGKSYLDFPKTSLANKSIKKALDAIGI